MGKRVLIADDEKEMVDLLEVALRREGFEVIVAYDGEEAKTKIIEENPEVILLDLMMPLLDGYAVLKWLREEKKLDIPIIIISAKDQIGDVKKSYLLEADHYIIKPVKVRELIKAINLVSFIKEQGGHEAS